MSTRGVAMRLRPTGSLLPGQAWRNYAIVIVFVGLFLVLTFSSDAFLTKTNLLNILDQWSPALIMAAASTIVFVSGGFDLSIGAIYALAGVTAALLVDDIGIILALIAGIAAGGVAGLVNGGLTTVGRVMPFLATLATGLIFGGIASALTNGDLIQVSEPGFTTLGTGAFLGISYAVWTCGAFVAACGFLLSRTVFGRSVYAAGGNPESARLSGVNVNAIRTVAFTLSGISAAVAGLIIASRTSTGQADAGGIGIALDALTGIVLGGTSIAGGEGAVWRTVFGVLVMAMIGNGFNLLGVSGTYQSIAQGLIILGAVSLDAWSRRPRP